MKVHVYVHYCGNSYCINDEPVSVIDAYSIIEQNHDETVEDLNLILNRFSLRGFHDAIKDRMNVGDDYDIVSASTGEILRRIHVSF